MDLNSILQKGWEALHSSGVKRSLSFVGTTHTFDATVQEARRATSKDNRYDFTEGDDRECVIHILKSAITSAGVTIKQSHNFLDSDGNYFEVVANRSQPHEIFDRYVCRLYRDG